MLRLHFLHHRKLLPKLCRCAWKSLTLFLHESFERRDIFPGGILVPQTFGGMANWNPHVHALITDACWDRKGNQFAMSKISDGDLKVDVSDPLEWIARITSHIPRKGAKQIIYYGAYSQAWRGRERRQGILPKVSTEEEPASSVKDRSSSSRRRRQQWAVLLKKVWNIDALKCPKFGGER